MNFTSKRIRVRVRPRWCFSISSVHSTRIYSLLCSDQWMQISEFKDHYEGLLSQITAQTRGRFQWLRRKRRGGGHFCPELFCCGGSSYKTSKRFGGGGGGGVGFEMPSQCCNYPSQVINDQPLIQTNTFGQWTFEHQPAEICTTCRKLKLSVFGKDKMWKRPGATVPWVMRQCLHDDHPNEFLLFKSFTPKSFHSSLPRNITSHSRKTFSWLSSDERWLYYQRVDPFTPKSDQVQISPVASPVILHQTVWRTWLFIAYSD